MKVEYTEFNVAKNNAYQMFPDMVRAMKRKNVLEAAKTLYEIGGISDIEYRRLLKDTINDQGYHLK